MLLDNVTKNEAKRNERASQDSPMEGRMPYFLPLVYYWIILK